MRFIFLLIALGLVVCTITLGGDPMAFINPPSILIVLGCGFFFAMAAHGYPALLNAISAAGNAEFNDREQAHTHATILFTLRNSFLGAGSVGTLIGQVQMLVQMDDPTTLGPSFAVSLLTLFYGIILAELIVTPMADRLLEQSDAPDYSAAHRAKTPVGTHLSLLFMALLLFFVLLFSMSAMTYASAQIAQTRGNQPPAGGWQASPTPSPLSSF
jgi:flagellar motor component MotA